MSIVGDLAPGRAAKLHFAFELAAVAACAAFASWTNGATETTGLLLQTLVPAVLWAVGASTLRLHDPYMHRQPLEDAALASVVLLTTAIAVAALGRWPGAGFGIGSNMELYLLLTVTAVLPARWMLFRRFTQREVPANGYDQVLVVGVGPLAACTAEDLAHCGPPRPVIGFVPLSDEPRAAEIPAARIIGAPHDLERLLCERPVTEVIIAGDVVHDGKAMQEVVRTCERLGVCFALPAAPLRLGRGRALLPRLIDDGYLHFSTMRPRPYQLALKRLFDLTASAAALVLLAPLLLTVAALVKLTSRGPVLFRQERVGLHGRRFHMLKFRSMVVDAEALRVRLAALNEQTGPAFKIKNDPRVTPLGRFIRRFSIDELPQLINVLFGDMSVVGPRPLPTREALGTEPWQRRRLSVRPGLTCIWQIAGRDQIKFRDWMYLDMRYIDHWSIARDLELVARTVPVVLTGKGAS